MTPGPPDFASTWASDTLEPSTAADTTAVKSLPEGAVVKQADTKKASDPFVRILHKVGAPPALLRSRSQMEAQSPHEELSSEQPLQGVAAEAALQATVPENKPHVADEVELSRTPAVIYLDTTNEGNQGSRASSGDTTVDAAGHDSDRGDWARTSEGQCTVEEEPLAELQAVEFGKWEPHDSTEARETGDDVFLAAPRAGFAHKEYSAATGSTPQTPCSLGSSAKAKEVSGKKETKGATADRIEEASSSDELQWPFESSLRPWEDVGKEKRQTAEGISGHQLEDHKKTRIWVIHKGVCTPVSWYLDTSAEDVKMSILCACDVLADEVEHEDHGKAAGFCLRQIRPLPDSADVDCDDLFMGVKTLTLRCALPPIEAREGLLVGVSEEEQPREAADGQLEDAEDKEVSVRVVLGQRVFSKDFPSLTDGATYLLEPRTSAGDDDFQQQEELASLRKLTGDKWRRLSVAVSPLLHIEAQKAVLQMRRGEPNLLKHTRFGHPHLRQFQLSADRQRLVWYSASKGKDASVVHIHDLRGLVLGQKSVTFMGYRIPALQHLSFSLVFKEDGVPPNFSAGVELSDACLEEARTLDLTCKDEFEFDTWVTGFKAIIAANKGLKLSKMNLLSHSRRFLKAIRRSDTTVQLTKLPEIKESAGLQDCMDLPWHPPEELERKYEEQRKRVSAVAEEIRTLDKKTVVRSNVDISVLVGAGPAYANLLGDSAEVDDEEMEFERMRELLKEVIAVLNKAKAELAEYRAAERMRRKSEEEAAASTDDAGSAPCNPDNAVESSGASEASQASEGMPVAAEGTNNPAIFAISSGGQVLMKSGAPGLTFEERFKLASASRLSPIDLETMQEQVKESFTNLLQRAASQTAEAQQLLSSALATAAAVVGVETEQQLNPSAQALPPEDIEKLKSINQLLWRAEVDVENIEDMLERLQGTSGFGGLALAGTVANLNQIVTEQVNKWSGQLASVVTGFLQKADVSHFAQGSALRMGPPLAYTESDSDDNDLI
ncbi:hypothetical protein Efla_003171 [Eimeria flavescens]